MEQVFWYLLAGTRGGPNRIRILDVLHDSPSNAHQISELLQLNYRTVRHHMRALLRNGLVVQPAGDAYASPYFLSGLTVDGWTTVLQLRERLRMGRPPGLRVKLTIPPRRGLRTEEYSGGD